VRSCSPNRLALTLLSIAATTALAGAARGQDFFFRRTQLSDAVQLREADASTQAHIERVDAFLADEQWDEAVETLRRLAAEHGDELIAVKDSPDARDNPKRPFGTQRYIPLRQWCHARLAAWSHSAPAALELYRSQVDPLVRPWLNKGVAERDQALLQRVVNEFYCSSYGDDALLALGDIALERGAPAQARACFEQISPELRAGEFETATDDKQQPLVSAGRPLWNEHRRESQLEIDKLRAKSARPNAMLAFPDTDLNLADVRARLALCSILEGSPARAEFELAQLKQLHPAATGVLSRKQVKLHEALGALLTESRAWPSRNASADWPTFAGNFDRNRIAAHAVDINGQPEWSIPLGLRMVLNADALTDGNASSRVAEAADGLLSVYPIVIGETLFFCDVAPAKQARDFPHWVTRLRAYDLRTGKPAWPSTQGLDEAESDVHDNGVVQQSRPFPVEFSDRSRWGVPRLTLSSYKNFVFARMGSPVTLQVDEEIRSEGRSSIVAIDIAEQGKLLWEPIEAEGDFAFEGPPVCDGTSLYIAMRRSLAQPQAHVACFDLKTGEPRWRTWVCAAESPSLGRTEEVTHNLLTLDGDKLYFNSNLGCVAALNCADGKIAWLTRYQRANLDAIVTAEPATNFQRDVNPCVLWKGLLFAAPSDCRDLLCIEAATGQLVWSQPAGDIVHLLGVGGGNLIASGQRLWWFDAETGEIITRYPQARRGDPQGYGRGTLAGDVVYCPTPSAVYVFDQRTAREVRQPIELDRRDATGGNLIASGERLLITTPDKVISFTGERGASAP
jgi:outer membrane protein assembly factor BamB